MVLGLIRDLRQQKKKNIGKPVVKSEQLMKTTLDIGTANSVKCSMVHPTASTAMCETRACVCMHANESGL